MEVGREEVNGGKEGEEGPKREGGRYILGEKEEKEEGARRGVLRGEGVLMREVC